MRSRVFSRSGPAMALVAVAAAVLPASAEAQPDYRDDRSTAESVIASLYNAIARQEYLRAWSYFRDEPGRPSFEIFQKGYETTASVRVKTGTGTSEGAAGSIFTDLPVVVEAVSTDGAVTVFAGCYQLRLVQPAAQAIPPFQPLGIVRGKLERSDLDFDAASGHCPEGGLQ